MYRERSMMSNISAAASMIMERRYVAFRVVYAGADMEFSRAISFFIIPFDLLILRLTALYDAICRKFKRYVFPA
jgi:hypothetical protein